MKNFMPEVLDIAIDTDSNTGGKLKITDNSINYSIIYKER
jgi:hypothetical protein